MSNKDFEKIVDTSDEWIIRRTGISERRILENDEPAYILGVEAAKQAITDANLLPENIDLIIVSTSTPDYFTPSTSCIIQKEIGAVNASAFDIAVACTGFIYSMTIAKQFIETGYYKHILIIANEAMSKVTEWTDRNTCVLFGDGAGAVVLGKVEDGYGIISTYIGADGSQGNNVTIPCLYLNEEDVVRRPNFKNMKTLWQEGQEVFKFAVKIMPAAVNKVIEDSDISLDDIKYIIPHQANVRIIESAAKRMGIALDKIYTTIRKYGNISSASIPIALDDAYNENLIFKGDNLVLVGFGGGLTWGSVLVKWSK